MSLKLSDTRVYEPQIRARLGTRFLAKPEVPKKMTLTVFMVKGETNTDDLCGPPPHFTHTHTHTHTHTKKMTPPTTPPVQPSFLPDECVSSVTSF